MYCVSRKTIGAIGKNTKGFVDQLSINITVKKKVAGG